ncbi:MAG: hypothetical protein HYV96_11135 [Opitutae bacterium]|nr:hypothetical protein [Opitutae bacterium]
MTTLTVSKAKAQFSGVARRVIKTKKPVLVRTPQGFIQIIPYDLPEPVPPAARGELKLTTRELELHNTFGESL